MALKIKKKIKEIGLSKISLSNILSRKKNDEVIVQQELSEEPQEIQVEDIEQVRILASSEHELKEKVGAFLTENANKLKKWYSDNQIDEKLESVAKKAGATVIYPVLLLYNLLKSPNVHSKDKMLIIAPLAYFVLPTDLIPDFLLGMGYIDDGVAVMTCIKTLASSITPELSDQTRTMCQDLVGDVDEDIINSVANAVNENQDEIIAFASKKYQEKKGKRK
ncbi:MAG: DUF1232 domain-containing protein [Bacteroidales bacterium]|nr:DUF1232 domain-containing protein [Bacteroidales bacterium]